MSPSILRIRCPTEYFYLTGLTPTRLKPAVSDDDERVEAGGPGEGVRLRRVGPAAHPPPARSIFTFGLDFHRATERQWR